MPMQPLHPRRLRGRRSETLPHPELTQYPQKQLLCHISKYKDTRREVDLIVESEGGKILGIEVKLSPIVTDDDVKNLLWLKENAKMDVIDLIVITTGDTAYRRKDGVAVLPLSLLAP